MENKTTIGHLFAFVTILIWGTTFISTKILLLDFQPIEILFFRFVMGLLVLVIAHPHPMKGTTKGQEATFALAGFCGVCMYYLLENIALTYTQASNVGVIISIAPFFTLVLTHLLMKKEDKLQMNFFVGFMIAMIGITMISFQGTKMQVNPLGDFLAVMAALLWACYSVLIRKISSFGYPTIQTTKRVFTYGILFMLPVIFFFDFSWDVTRLANPVYLFNIIFLGVGASALCFVTWNYAVKILGAVKTSIYIYMVPVITIITSMIVLHEKITILAAIGTVLTLVGLVISESKLGHKRIKNSIY